MQSDSKTAYLLLGSNLGNREKYVSDAIKLLEERVGGILQTSSIYETAAWGNTTLPSFINVAVEIKTVLDPPQLLETVLQIEADLGRIRYEKWGSRAIDIDIILYEDEIVDIAEKLQIPHPEMQNRRFVLLPLTEIAPMVIHPILKQNISQLLEDLADNLTVLKR